MTHPWPVSYVEQRAGGGSTTQAPGHATMRKMGGEDADLGSLFEQAATIASRVPKSMQEAAFQRALDHLLGSPQGGTPGSEGGRRGASSTGRKGRTPGTTRPKIRQSENDADDRVERLIAGLTRADVPLLTPEASVLTRSLALLHVAEEKFGIGALSAAEIATVLTSKFKLRTKESAVRMALNRAGSAVDHQPQDKGAGRWAIMAEGELLLKESATGGSAASAKKASARSTRKKTSATQPRKAAATPADKAAKKSLAATKKTAPAGSSRSGRPGPKVLLQELIDNGWFNTSRTIGQVISHIADNRGHRYKSTDLSPAFVRLLREGALTRERNSNGQFEYRSK